jgi:hypothetical protein
MIQVIVTHGLLKFNRCRYGGVRASYFWMLLLLLVSPPQLELSMNRVLLTAGTCNVSPASSTCVRSWGIVPADAQVAVTLLSLILEKLGKLNWGGTVSATDT